MRIKSIDDIKVGDSFQWKGTMDDSIGSKTKKYKIINVDKKVNFWIEYIDDTNHLSRLTNYTSEFFVLYKQQKKSRLPSWF